MYNCCLICLPSLVCHHQPAAYQNRSKAKLLKNLAAKRLDFYRRKRVGARLADVDDYDRNAARRGVMNESEAGEYHKTRAENEQAVALVNLQTKCCACLRLQFAPRTFS